MRVLGLRYAAAAALFLSTIAGVQPAAAQSVAQLLADPNICWISGGSTVWVSSAGSITGAQLRRQIGNNRATVQPTFMGYPQIHEPAGVWRQVPCPTAGTLAGTGALVNPASGGFANYSAQAIDGWSGAIGVGHTWGNADGRVSSNFGNPVTGAFDPDNTFWSADLRHSHPFLGMQGAVGVSGGFYTGDGGTLFGSLQPGVDVQLNYDRDYFIRPYAGIYVPTGIPNVTFFPYGGFTFERGTLTNKVFDPNLSGSFSKSVTRTAFALGAEFQMPLSELCFLRFGMVANFFNDDEKIFGINNGGFPFDGRMDSGTETRAYISIGTSLNRLQRNFIP
jgi:hypothetical protein